MNSAAATAASLAPAAHTVGRGTHHVKENRIIMIGSGGSSWKISARGRSGLIVISRDISETGKMNNNQIQKKKKKKDSTKEIIDDDIKNGSGLQQQPSSSVSVMKRLDDVNPVGLGRKSRQIFDEVWRKFSELGQISRTIRDNDETSLLIREGGPMCEFAIPGAQNTTVLVVGATSRVGRIVVRKLMLRGYTVKVPSLTHSLTHMLICTFSLSNY